MSWLWEYWTGKPDQQKEPNHFRRTDQTLMEMGPKKIDIKRVSRRLTPINKAPNENIYDSLAFVIYCPKHNKMAVSTTEHIGGTSAIWLPFIYLSDTIGWGEAINDGLELILSDANKALRDELKAENPWDICILNILRTQLPHTFNYITRLICLARLHTGSKVKVCCRNTSRITWYRLDQLKSVDNLWSNEVIMYSEKVNIDMTDPEVYQTVTEKDLEWALTYLPREQTRNEEEDLLKDLNLSERHIERIYIDFLEHCFPAYVMTFYSFKNYCRRHGLNWDDSRMSKCFTAFTYRQSGYVDFHELLLGMACIDPEALNPSARAKFIFRFYDTKKVGFLNETDFTALVKDLNPEMSDNLIHQKVKEDMKLLKATQKGIAFDDWFTAIGSLKFRGTSLLCRAPKSLFDAIYIAKFPKGIESKPNLKKSVIDYIKDGQYEGVCKSCKNNRYKLAAHSVTIGINGKITDYQEIKEYKVVSEKHPISGQNNPYLSESYSFEVVFNPKSLANTMKEEIQKFNAIKGTRDQPKGLMANNEQREEFSKIVEELAKQMIGILDLEDRCVKVSSPSFVIGDIHGNLEDLLSIEKYLFKCSPILTANYLFLGDYVDRGMWSVECALYLFCNKILAPNNFFMLRGNHETRVLQRNYSFEKECNRKYGKSFGNRVFESFNKVFDRLPFAAVIDDSIFCCHGGIPSDCSTIKEINDIPRVVKDVENESKIGWELLWNDPVHMKEFRQTIDLLQKRENQSRGFVDNQRRGTANYFNEIGCQDFLNSTGLSFLIRAHEVPHSGSRFHFDDKCLTIFSCSHYCGSDNKAAVVHISDQTLRIISLDTTKNAPATDDTRSRIQN